MPATANRDDFSPVITRNEEGEVVARDYRPQMKNTMPPGGPWALVFDVPGERTYWERPATEEEAETVRPQRPEWWDR